MPRPLNKKVTLAPGAERSLNVNLKSLRNPPLDITLTSLPSSTSILDLKSTISTQTSIPTEKLRILHNKKPVPDSKILKDIVREQESKVDFSVMVLGGAAAMKRGDEEVIPPVVQGKSGLEVPRGKEGEEFWTDLKGFLIQRLRDEGGGERVWTVFRRAWEQQ
jgi:hypothetical protein